MPIMWIQFYTKVFLFFLVSFLMIILAMGFVDDGTHNDDDDDNVGEMYDF